MSHSLEGGGCGDISHVSHSLPLHLIAAQLHARTPHPTQTYPTPHLDLHLRLEKIAEEARLCVAEEMGREAVNDIRDRLDPAIDELKLQLAAMTAATPAAPSVEALQSQVHRLSDNVNALKLEVAAVAASTTLSGGVAVADAVQQADGRLALQSAQVSELRGQLDSVMEQLEALSELQAEVAADVLSVREDLAQLSGAVDGQQAPLAQVRRSVEALQLEVGELKEAVASSAARSPGVDVAVMGPSTSRSFENQLFESPKSVPAIPSSGLSGPHPLPGMASAYRNAAFEDEEGNLHGSNSSSPLVAAPALEAAALVGAAAALGPTPLRVKHVELAEGMPSPATPGDDSSVRDMALYYEKLAQRQAEPGTSTAGAAGVGRPRSSLSPAESLVQGSREGTSAGGAAALAGVAGGAVAVAAGLSHDRSMPSPPSASGSTSLMPLQTAAAAGAMAPPAKGTTAAASFSKQHFKRRGSSSSGGGALDESLDLTNASYISTELLHEEDEFDSPPELPGLGSLAESGEVGLARSGGLSAGGHSSGYVVPGPSSDLFISSSELGNQAGVSIDIPKDIPLDAAVSPTRRTAAASPSGPQKELSTLSAGADFNVEISNEAERMAEMLSASKPPAAAIQWSSNPLSMPDVQDEMYSLQPTRLSFDMANPRLPASTSDWSQSQEQGGPGAGPGGPGVQGSLEFIESSEDLSASSLDFSHPHVAAAGGVGLEDSGELEVFAPPRRQAPPTDAVRDVGPGGGSGGGAVVARALPAELYSSSGAMSLSMDASPGTYKVQLVTSSKVGAGTGSDVHITLHGADASYSTTFANPGQSHFQRGQVDELVVDAGHALGDLTAVHFWHAGAGFGSSWCIERVQVEQPLSGLSWEFTINDWLKGGEASGKTYRLGSSRCLSRESSLTGVATGVGLAAGVGLASASLAGARGPGPRPSRLPPIPGARNAGAFGDESFDISSELPSPANASNSQLGMSGSSRLARGASQGTSAAAGGGMSTTDSFDGDGGGPGRGYGQQSGVGAAHSASNIPSGIGVVLEEDLEDGDSHAGVPVVVLGRPPPPPAAPLPSSHPASGDVGASFGASGSGGSFGADTFDSLPDLGLSGAGGSKAGRPPLPPPAHRSSRDGSSSSRGGVAGAGGAGGELDGDLGAQVSHSQLSWEGSDMELSVEGSEMSLCMFHETGARPPTAGTSVNYAGTSRKRVSFADYAEEFQYEAEASEDSGSVRSITEEELLAAQGLDTRCVGGRGGGSAGSRGGVGGLGTCQRWQARTHLRSM